MHSFKHSLIALALLTLAYRLDRSRLGRAVLRPLAWLGEDSMGIYMSHTTFLMLAAYSLGLAIPFLLSSLMIDRFLTFFDRFKRFFPVVTRVSGIILIAVGLLLVTDYFATLSRIAFSLTPDWLFAIERSLLKWK